MVLYDCSFTQSILTNEGGTMFKRFKLWWLFATIEFHWLFIKHERKLGTRKINEGVEVTSPQMLLLSNHLNTHILRAETARKKI